MREVPRERRLNVNDRPTNLDRCPGSGRPTGDASTCPVCNARFYLERPGEAPLHTVVEHARRYEPSATYYPRTGDFRNDPWLCAMAQRGMSEEQVIDVMARENRWLRGEAMRRAELFEPPMSVIVNGAATERAACAKIADVDGATVTAEKIRARGESMSLWDFWQAHPWWIAGALFWIGAVPIAVSDNLGRKP